MPMASLILAAVVALSEVVTVSTVVLSTFEMVMVKSTVVIALLLARTELTMSELTPDPAAWATSMLNSSSFFAAVTLLKAEASEACTRKLASTVSIRVVVVVVLGSGLLWP